MNKLQNNNAGGVFNKYLNSNINIWELKEQGQTLTQIGKKLNLTSHQVNHRWKGFNKAYLSWAKVGRL